LNSQVQFLLKLLHFFILFRKEPLFLLCYLIGKMAICQLKLVDIFSRFLTFLKV